MPGAANQSVIKPNHPYSFLLVRIQPNWKVGHITDMNGWLILHFYGHGKRRDMHQLHGKRIRGLNSNHFVVEESEELNV